jgi:PAS domain S-box-containing protein
MRRNAMDMDIDQICLYAVGLLTSTDAEQLEAAIAAHPELVPLFDGIQNLSCALLCALSPRAEPRTNLKSRILAAASREPAFVLADPNGYVLAVNDAFTALCGYHASELIGRKPGHVLRGPATCPVASRTLRDAVNEAKPIQQEIVNYHRNGEPYWVRVEITPLWKDDGLLAGFAALERKIDDKPVPVAV